MKTKKKDKGYKIEKNLEYEVEDFTPSFYILAIVMLVGMVVVVGLFIVLVISITKILMGTI